MQTIGLGLRTFAVAIALIAALVLGAVAAPRVLPGFDFSQKRSIGVKGKADVLVLAERVIVSGAVTTSAVSAADALNQNNAIVARILDGLKADGIGRAYIRTQGFSITPQHPRRGESSYSEDEMVTIGYVVKNSIVVALPVNQYSGKLLDRLIRLGATNIASVEFAVNDEKKHERTARAMAAIDARNNAEIAAKALGLRVGRVIGIDRADLPYDTGDYTRDRSVMPPPPPAAMMVAPVQEVGLVAREQVFSARMTVVFELE
jgi:uncharacterized protein